MGTVLDLPQMRKRKYKFQQEVEKEIDGELQIAVEEVCWEYTPLNQSQVEEARAAVPAPAPPMKRLEGSAEELIAQKREGYSIAEPNFDDPGYKAAKERYETDLSLEMCRLALGWDMDRETFAQEMRSRVEAGVLQGLINAVAATTWRLDQIARFLGNSSP